MKIENQENQIAEKKPEQKKMVKDGKTFVFVESTKKSKYRKGRWMPENHEQIDKWEVLKMTQDEGTKPFLDESSFVLLFPKYREKYIKECWGIVLKNLKEIGIKVSYYMYC